MFPTQFTGVGTIHSPGLGTRKGVQTETGEHNGQWDVKADNDRRKKGFSNISFCITDMWRIYFFKVCPLNVSTSAGYWL